MRRIELRQIKAIFAMGRSLNLVESGRPDDNLHQLIEAATGKEHISQLTYSEASDVIRILKDQMRGSCAGSDSSPAAPAGCSEGQRKKIWRLMYRLADCDEQPGTARIGDRLVGVIRRELQIDASVMDPLRWLTYWQASRLIEAIKGYVDNAEAGRGKAQPPQTDLRQRKELDSVGQDG